MRNSYRDVGFVLALIVTVVAGGVWASDYTDEFFRRILSMLG